MYYYLAVQICYMCIAMNIYFFGDVSKYLTFRLSEMTKIDMTVTSTRDDLSLLSTTFWAEKRTDFADSLPKRAKKSETSFPKGNKIMVSDQTPILRMIYDMFEFYQFKSDLYFISLLHLLLYYYFIFYKTSCLHFN